MNTSEPNGYEVMLEFLRDKSAKTITNILKMTAQWISLFVNQYCNKADCARLITLCERVHFRLLFKALDSNALKKLFENIDKSNLNTIFDAMFHVNECSQDLTVKRKDSMEEIQILFDKLGIEWVITFLNQMTQDRSKSLINNLNRETLEATKNASGIYPRLIPYINNRIGQLYALAA